LSVKKFGIEVRPPKPRTQGRTNILDPGLGLDSLRSALQVGGRYVDLAKIGWGTALVLDDLDERIALYEAFDIEVCLGGTMFEYAYSTNQVEAYANWLGELGIATVEISDGSVEIEVSDKLRWIEYFAADFRVLSEVGSKDSSAIVSPARWVAEIRAELNAGAAAVILEGRESGNAGLYRPSGEMRTGLVDEILESGISPASLIFEAPQKTHQTYLLEVVGRDVNPDNLARVAQRNRSRLLWQISRVVEAVPVGSTVVDLGGGAVPFMAVCQQMGYSTIVVDDFGDATYDGVDVVLGLFDDLGVEVRNVDIFSPDFRLGEAGSIGMVCSHDSMEHWHQSPKQLFHQCWSVLQPGGIFWLGVPNAVNVRKRLMVPLGRASWSSMDHWYEQPEFRGHVREPILADLRYIAADIGASDYEVFGRNWLGYRNPKAAVRALTPYVDRALQLRPSLCSDLYLWAQRA